MMSATQDYYETLGVQENASEDEVRSAYRDLARKYHPDKTGGDKEAEERLKEINAAYDTLKRSEKRKEYDQQRAFGAQGFQGAGGGFDFSGASSSGADFSDLFSSMFGGAGGASARTYSAARPGNDLEASVRITLNEVATGTRKTLRIRRNETCTDCSGSGAAPGSSPIPCSDCGGAGQFAYGSGMFQMNQPCPRCHGTGQTASKPCTTCAGQGCSKAQRDINVRIPVGAKHGMRLRLNTEGEAGLRGGPASDLYVRIEIDTDPFFTRDGNDLLCEVPITFADAALGAEVTVPTLDGIAKLTIAPGTQNGTQLRMREMGLPVAGGKRGDERVKVIVEVPKKLSRAQVKLLREFDGDYEPESHPLLDIFKKLLRKLRPSEG